MSIIIKYKHKTAELLYTLDVVFNEFLGVEYCFSQEDNDEIHIEMIGSESKIVLDASFWENLSKYGIHSKENIPSLPLVVWIPEKDIITVDLLDDHIPVLFGTASFHKKKSIQHFGIDILGTIFFMISRYEETIIQTVDKHGRFPSIASIACQANFLHRPLVDEYIEVLWTSLKQCWPHLKRKKRKAKTLISCDVDIPYSPSIKSIAMYGRQLMGDVIKRRDFKLAANTAINPIATAFKNYRFDVNNTFDWIMDVNEQAGNTVSFYFICDHSAGNIDGIYSLSEQRIKKLIYKIHERGHEIGVHTSYDSYQNEQQIQKEIGIMLNTMADLKIIPSILGNRQHYLRWSSSCTPRYLDSAGFSYDTSLNFAEQPGFRCGTSHEYTMYDIPKRCSLGIKQRPLIAMECSVLDSRYMGLGCTQEAMEIFLSLKEACNKFNGSFTLLWHNSHLATKTEKNFYSQLINCI